MRPILVGTLLLAGLAVAQQNPPRFGRNSRIDWIEGPERVMKAGPTPNPRLARELLGKRYLFVYIKPSDSETEPAGFSSAEVQAAARGAWAFSWEEFSKENALIKGWGVTSAPAAIGCDLHGNEFMHTADISPVSLRRLLTAVPDSIQKYEARLKADHARAVDSAKDDPRKAIRPLVDLLQVGRPGYKEVKEALEILADCAKDDWRKAELAETVSPAEALVALEEIAKVYRSSPPGVQAERRIAELEMARGNFVAAVQMLERILKHGAPWLRSEHDAAAALLNRIRKEARGGEVAELQKQYERARAAEAALQARPDDPAAALELGRFLCGVRGEWEKGLPYLAKGADAALQSVARKDLEAPADAISQVELGDLWWDLGEKAAAERDLFRTRACHWYDRASGALSGLARVRVEKRLEEGARLRPGVNLLKRVDPDRDAVGGEWLLGGGALVSPAQSKGSRASLAIPYSPPDEYTLRMTVERKQGDGMFAVGLGSGAMRVTLILGFQQGPRLLSALSLVDGKQPAGSETAKEGAVFNAGKPLSIVCTVRTGRISVELDGKPFILWAGDFARLARNSVWRVPADRALFVGSENSVFHITQFVLTPISGQGKELR